MLGVKAARFAVCFAVLVVGRAEAQPLTTTINPSASPITVSQQPEKAAVRPKVSDQRLVNIAFGATVNSGNTQTYAGTLGGRFGLIHNIHQLTVEALGAMGGTRQRESSEQPDDDADSRDEERVLRWTARNVIARVRYDVFLSTMDALFVAMAPRRDTFAGIDVRLQNQAGYLRNLFFPVDAHRFWIELGYDFTYDNFRALEGEVRRTEASPAFVHSARLFFGYTNRLSPTASLSVGAETLLDLEEADNVRVNGLSELTSSITHSFKLGLQVRVLFDNEPVEATEKYDLIATAQLVYTFDSLAGALNAPCPVCDCTPQVQAARASCRAPSPPRTAPQITR